MSRFFVFSIQEKKNYRYRKENIFLNEILQQVNSEISVDNHSNLLWDSKNSIPMLLEETPVLPLVLRQPEDVI